MESLPTEIINLLSSHGYYFLFWLVVVEGPVITVLSGMLTSLGIFNFYIAYIVIVLGDLVGDAGYYFAGKWWLNSLVNKRFKSLGEIYKKHSGKILFFGKLSSLIGSAVMMVAGAAGTPFSYFILVNMVGSLFKSLLLLLIGYYFGGTLTGFGKYLDTITSLSLLVLTVVIATIYFLVSKISGRYFKKLQED